MIDRLLGGPLGSPAKIHRLANAHAINPTSPKSYVTLPNITSSTSSSWPASRCLYRNASQLFQTGGCRSSNVHAICMTNGLEASFLALATAHLTIQKTDLRHLQHTLTGDADKSWKQYASMHGGLCKGAQHACLCKCLWSSSAPPLRAAQTNRLSREEYFGQFPVHMHQYRPVHC